MADARPRLHDQSLVAAASGASLAVPRLRIAGTRADKDGRSKDAAPARPPAPAPAPAPAAPKPRATPKPAAPARSAPASPKRRPEAHRKKQPKRSHSQGPPQGEHSCRARHECSPCGGPWLCERFGCFFRCASGRRLGEAGAERAGAAGLGVARGLGAAGAGAGAGAGGRAGAASLLRPSLSARVPAMRRRGTARLAPLAAATND